MIKHFYIFRHGQCPFNVSGHIQGQRFNGNLTAEGRRQAARTAERLKDKHITLIVSSPMKRAMQTAAIVAGRCGAPILIDHRFIEVNMGIVEGMHISAVEKISPNSMTAGATTKPAMSALCLAKQNPKFAAVFFRD